MPNDDLEARLQDANYAIAGSQERLEIVEEDGAELYEIEVPEDAILYYLEDEDGNEVGFAIEEDGEPIEYFYAEYDGDYEVVEVIEEPVGAPEEPAKAVEEPAVAAADPGTDSSAASAATSGDSGADQSADAQADPDFLTKEELVELAGDLKDIAKESAQIIGEFKSTYDEFRDALGIKSIPGARRRR